MKLGGDEARLSLHDFCIVLPRSKEGLLIGLVEREDIHQHDRASFDRELTLDREGR
jgi:hypothetical protein